MVSVILKDLIWKIVECWLDDLCIHSEDDPLEFIRNVDLVLARCEKHNVLLRPVKCEFGYREIYYVDHMLSKDGIELTEDRKLKFAMIPQPTTKKEMLSFLSTGNYFHHFVQNYSSIVAPLFYLTRPSSVFHWTPDTIRQSYLVRRGEEVEDSGERSFRYRVWCQETRVVLIWMSFLY